MPLSPKANPHLLILGTALVGLLASPAQSAPHAGPIRTKEKPAASKNKAAPGEVLWSAPDGRYSIRYPEDWTLADPPPTGCEMAVLSDLESAEDYFYENVNVVLEAIPHTSTQEDYLVAVRANLETVGDYEEHATGTWSRDGEPGIWIEYSARFDPAFLSHNLVFITTRPDQAFIITCSSVEDSFEAWEDRLRAIGMTFQFE